MNLRGLLTEGVEGVCAGSIDVVIDVVSAVASGDVVVSAVSAVVGVVVCFAFDMISCRLKFPPTSNTPD